MCRQVLGLLFHGDVTVKATTVSQTTICSNSIIDHAKKGSITSNVSNSSLKNVILIRSRAIDTSIHKVAKTLADNGYNVKVLVWDREGRKIQEKRFGYVVVHFGLKAPYDKITAAFYLPLWWLYEFIFLLMNSARIIHACDLDTLLPAIIVKLFKRIKLCYTIYDFYADNLPGSFPSFTRKLIARIEKFGIGLCDCVFIVDPSRYKQIKGARIKKLAILYNSPPDCVEEKLISKPKVTSTVTLFYAGVIHRSRGLIDVLKAIRDLNGVKLIVAGSGPDVKIFKNLPRKLKEKVEYIGFIPYQEVIKRTLEADILFALYDPNIPNNIYASPNKLFEAMMCAKPIIVNDGTTMANIVRKEKCGFVINYGNADELKKAIETLKNNPNLAVVLGKNGRNAYLKKYNWNLIKERLLQLYDLIVQQPCEGK